MNGQIEYQLNSIRTYSAIVKYYTKTDGTYWQTAWDWLYKRHGLPGDVNSVWSYQRASFSSITAAEFLFTHEKDRNWFLLHFK